MYIYWWNVLLLAFLFFYLVIRIDRLCHKIKELRKIIAKLEGREESGEDVHLESTGDCEGMG